MRSYSVIKISSYIWFTVAEHLCFVLLPRKIMILKLFVHLRLIRKFFDQLSLVKFISLLFF